MSNKQAVSKTSNTSSYQMRPISDTINNYPGCHFWDQTKAHCYDESNKAEVKTFENWFKKNLTLNKDANGVITASFDPNAYAKFLKKQLGIKYKVVIKDDNGSSLKSGTAGNHRPVKKDGRYYHEIKILRNSNRRPDQLANTIAHEMKHAKDFEQKIDNLKKELAEIDKDKDFSKIDPIAYINNEIKQLDKLYNDGWPLSKESIDKLNKYKELNKKIEEERVKHNNSVKNFKNELKNIQDPNKKLTPPDDVYKYGESAEEAFRRVYNEKLQKGEFGHNPQTTNQQAGNYLGNHIGNGAVNRTPKGTNGTNYGNPSINPGFVGPAGSGAFQSSSADDYPHEQGGFAPGNGGPAVNASSESLGELMQVIKNEAAEFDNIKKSIEQDLKNSLSWWDDMNRDKFVNYYNQNSEPKITSVIGELMKTAGAVNKKREEIIKYKAVKY